MSNLSGKPLRILKKDTEQYRGRNALSMNIEAIKTVAEAIRTTLGPKGLNKMIVDSMKEVTITGDGAKILEEQTVGCMYAVRIKYSGDIQKLSFDMGESETLYFDFP